MKKALLFLLVFSMIIGLFPVVSSAIGTTIEMNYDDYLTLSGTVTVPAGDKIVEWNSSTSKLHAIGVGETTINVDGSSTPVTVSKAKLNLVLIAGQSNADGVFGLRNGVDAVVTDTGYGYYWDGSKMVDLKSYISTLDSSKSIGFYPALAYEWYKLTGEKTLIVKTVAPGNPMSSWANYITGAHAVMTTNTVNAVNSCKKSIDKSKYEIAHTGYYWLQGESDSSISSGFYPLAEQYGTAFAAMNTAYLNALGEGSYVGIMSCRTGNGVYENIEYCGMRVAQQDFANQNSNVYMASVITDDWYEQKNVSFTSDTGMTITGTTAQMGADNIHYNQIGYNILGLNAADNIYKALTANQAITDIELIGHDGHTKYAENDTINVNDNLRNTGASNPFESEMAQLVARPVPVSAACSNVTMTLTDSKGKVVNGIMDNRGYINTAKLTKPLTLTVTAGDITKTYTLTKPGLTPDDSEDEEYEETEDIEGWVASDNLPVISNSRVSTISKVNDSERGEVYMVAKDVDPSESTSNQPVVLASKTFSNPIDMTSGKIEIDFFIKTENKDDWACIQVMLNNQLVYRLDPSGTIVRDAGGWYGGAFKEADLGEGCKSFDGEWRKLRLEISSTPENNSVMPYILIGDEWKGGWGGGKLSVTQSELKSLSIAYIAQKAPASNETLKVYFDNMIVHTSGDLVEIPGYDGWTAYEAMEVLKGTDGPYKSNAYDTRVEAYNDSTRGTVTKITKDYSSNEYTSFVSIPLATKKFDVPVTLEEGMEVSVEFWLKADGRQSPVNWADIGLSINNESTFSFTSSGTVSIPEGPAFQKEGKTEYTFNDGQWRKFKLTLKPREDKIATNYSIKVLEDDAWVDQYIGGTKMNKIDSIDQISITYRNTDNGGAVRPGADGQLNLYIDDLNVTGKIIDTTGISDDNFDIVYSKTGPTYNFDITVSDDVSLDSGELMLAGYSGGVLTGVVPSTVTNANRSSHIEFRGGEIDYFKVMLLDGLKGIKPLTNFLIINEVPEG